jgi:hypothetical protein
MAPVWLRTPALAFPSVDLSKTGVMAGLDRLDPAIHRLAKQMDPRVKPAGDAPGERASLADTCNR